jgi:hypothetical protein
MVVKFVGQNDPGAHIVHSVFLSFKHTFFTRYPGLHAGVQGVHDFPLSSSSAQKFERHVCGGPDEQLNPAGQSIHSEPDPFVE